MINSKILFENYDIHINYILDKKKHQVSVFNDGQLWFCGTVSHLNNQKKGVRAWNKLVDIHSYVHM